MCKTSENGVYAFACSWGLVIARSKDLKLISTISTHLKGKYVLSISYCGDKRLILAILKEPLTLLDY